jgi:hypothetical protein
LQALQFRLRKAFESRTRTRFPSDVLIKISPPRSSTSKPTILTCRFINRCIISQFTNGAGGSSAPAMLICRAACLNVHRCQLLSGPAMVLCSINMPMLTRTAFIGLLWLVLCGCARRGQHAQRDWPRYRGTRRLIMSLSLGDSKMMISVFIYRPPFKEMFINAHTYAYEQ